MQRADFGTITILWSQPVTALQILSPDGKWRWIRHMDNALVRIYLDESYTFMPLIYTNDLWY